MRGSSHRSVDEARERGLARALASAWPDLWHAVPSSTASVSERAVSARISRPPASPPYATCTSVCAESGWQH
eukprot:3911130-Prymnesium_polylepis.1